VVIETEGAAFCPQIEESVAEVSARLAAIEQLLLNLPRAGGGLDDAPEQGRYSGRQPVRVPGERLAIRASGGKIRL